MNFNIIQVNEYTKPIGLENIGATCYMNAVLQCFYHVKVLTNELLKIIPQLPMISAYKDVISQLSSNSLYSARPINFKNVISKNPLFRGIQANDSKDLILYFLETIENELTALNYFFQNYKYINRIRNMKNVQDPALMNIINQFQNNHKSIISDLFYGFKKQILTCKECRVKLTNYQIINLIIFPIEAVYNSKDKNKSANTSKYNEVKESYNFWYTTNQEYGKYYPSNKYYKGNNRTEIPSYLNYGGNYKSGPKKVSLYECFDYEMIPIDFFGDNQIFCKNCNKMCDGISENIIFSTPYILILILNRGKGNEFDCDVEFNETINIRKYVESHDCPLDYNLIGVISHLGESNMSGHFIADCKHFDGKWYRFNDGIVSGPNDHYSQRGIPYVLFYQYNRI